MAEKRYLIKLKPPDLMSETVEAAKVEIHGDHLVFLNEDGRLVGMFLFEIVRSPPRWGSQLSEKREKTPNQAELTTLKSRLSAG